MTRAPRARNASSAPRKLGCSTSTTSPAPTNTLAVRSMPCWQPLVTHTTLASTCSPRAWPVLVHHLRDRLLQAIHRRNLERGHTGGERNQARLVGQPQQLALRRGE